MTLKDCLFGAVNLTKNAEPDKYFYSGYGIEFDSGLLFAYPGFHWGKNVVVFGVENNSSVRLDNNEKDILVLGEDPTQGLDGTTTKPEAKYSISFSKSKKQNLFKSLS